MFIYIVALDDIHKFWLLVVVPYFLLVELRIAWFEIVRHGFVRCRGSKESGQDRSEWKQFI